MRSLFKKLGVGVLVAALGFGATSAFGQVERADAASTSVVINEVYGGGGNSGATHNQDFIELVNLSSEAVSLAGWKVEYYSAAGNSGGATTLTGTIQPGDHYLIGQAYGSNRGLTAFESDETGTLAMSSTNGAVELKDPSGAVIDLVGFGSAIKFEGQAAPTLSNSTSAERNDPTIDTDDNRADFTVGAPTPQKSADVTEPTDPVDPTDPTDPTDPVDPTDPAEGITAITEIQGTSATSPLVGQTVTTEGVVTAVYHGANSKNGFYLQMPVAYDAAAHAASTAVFVYSPTLAPTVAIGDSVRVTGAVAEFYEQTQISATSLEQLAEPLGAVEPVAAAWPTDAEGRELLEGMLIRPTTGFVVTDHYELNRYGQLTLAAGDSPLITPTEAGAPGSAEAIAQHEQNQQLRVILDDGSSVNYSTNTAAKSTPLPYLTLETPITIGAPVTFDSGVIVDYSFDEWRFQPQQRVTGLENSPVTFGDVREAKPADVGGDITVGTFNVLNYFTTLGDTEAGCRYYDDREGNPTTTNYCGPRGAYDQANFERQQAKIVTAINKLDASVVSLMEIEDSSDFGQERDHALAYLVDRLNEAAGTEKWAYVPSPESIPANGDDVIRTALIYQPAEVSYVEGSVAVLDDPAFVNARAPLSAAFSPVANPEVKFLVLVNHLKSKGGTGTGDNADDTRGPAYSAGSFNGDRTRQAEALVAFAEAQKDAQGTELVFLTGDFNAYSAETPVSTITAAGYERLASSGEYSYHFRGMVGSLDHVFVSDAAAELVTGVDIWTINAYEPIALEYSRYNGNITPLYAPDQYRSSDHNPAVVGLDIPEAEVAPTGSLSVQYFRDQNLDGAYDAGADLTTPDDFLYVKDAAGNWWGTTRQADGTYALPELPVGPAELYFPVPNSYVSTEVFTLDGARLPQLQNERVEGATYVGVDGSTTTFTVSSRLSAVGPVEIVEGAPAEYVAGWSSVTAIAEVVVEGTTVGRQDLAELVFANGDDRFDAAWTDSSSRYRAVKADGSSSAYFLAPTAGIEPTAVEGYEIVSVKAYDGSTELAVAEADGVYTVPTAGLSASFAQIRWVVEVAEIVDPVDPTDPVKPDNPNKGPGNNSGNGPGGNNGNGGDNPNKGPGNNNGKGPKWKQRVV